MNAAVGGNYAYVGDRVLPGTPIGWFGPWPARALLLWAATVIVWSLMWRLARAKRP